MSQFKKLINKIKIHDVNSNYSLNEYINYISNIPEVRRLSLLIGNKDSYNDIYQTLVELDDSDELIVSAMLLAFISSVRESAGFAMIISNYSDVYPKASAIACSYLLSRSINV